ncbi:MAG: type II toxin-antitoxin system VapC family toxin [Planctomycetia bacterium]
MRHLLDAHTVIWALDDPSRLGARARSVLEDPANDLVVNVGTIWELSIKTGLGKLSLSLPYRQWVERALSDLGLAVSPITVEFTERQMALPFHHRDPFDRLLVAQCLVETIPLVSADSVLDQYGVTRLWD